VCLWSAYAFLIVTRYNKKTRKSFSCVTIASVAPQAKAGNSLALGYELGRRCIGGADILNLFTPLLRPVPIAQFLPDFFLVASIVQRLGLIEPRHGIDHQKKTPEPLWGENAPVIYVNTLSDFFTKILSHPNKSIKQPH
jgi:hypothetical protein